MPQIKTAKARINFTTYNGTDVRALTISTYNLENGVVSGSGPGKSATIGIFVKIPDQSTFGTVDPNNLYTDPQTVNIDPGGTNKTEIQNTYYYRVGKFNENGKFEPTKYTDEVSGLQENFDLYNTNNPKKSPDNKTIISNQLNNVTASANKAIANQAGIVVNNPKLNQTNLVN